MGFLPAFLQALLGALLFVIILGAAVAVWLVIILIGRDVRDRW